MARTTSRCPECHFTFGLNLPVLHGCIGSKLYRCRRCDNVTQSHRGEWPSKSRSERRYYVICSAMFTIIASVMASFVAVMLFQYLEDRLPSPIWVVTTGFVVAHATALWQGGRVFASLQRDGNGSIDPRTVSIFSPQTNQLWTILVPFVTAITMAFLWRNP